MNEQFLRFTYEDSHELPGTVIREVFRYVGLMVATENIQNNPELGIHEEDTVARHAATFENSDVQIGFTEDVRDEMKEYYIDTDTWPDVTEGDEPVALWYSGLSTGCTQVLFLKPDGSFVWTEP